MAACDPGTTEPYESWEALDDPSVSSVCGVTIFPRQDWWVGQLAHCLVRFVVSV